ncbi:phage tail assembly chaperone G [Mechercharimyces sp. CAU 1602]|uniref:phage tail assembly chaperone G n=1 Tax=Mechercharimyces sp. CAU 1602 TaxID=2973933 RepID=UPI002163BE87|nr:hypothetical protein [Mechercharimyces sp. CAU 1602]MCS1351146.1 hypothetical protein [Mechercharimyces sp. CAU 1602]
MLKIELQFDGEKKMYMADFISGRMFRRALDLVDKQQKFLKKMSELEETEEIQEEQQELLDELFLVISEVFTKQFTPQEYEAGTDARHLTNQSWAIVYGIVNQVFSPLSEDGNGDKKKKSV